MGCLIRGAPEARNKALGASSALLLDTASTSGGARGCGLPRLLLVGRCRRKLDHCSPLLLQLRLLLLLLQGTGGIICHC